MQDQPQPDTHHEVVISDARTMRALAHPARITVLHHLYAGETLTATEFAQICDLTPSAMSYHLRALQKWGLITRAEPIGDGRERPWRAVGGSIRLAPDGSIAADAAKGQVWQSLVDLLRGDLSGDNPGVTGFTVVPVTLTDDEARQLMTQLGELLERRSEAARPPTGTRRYHAYWALLPLNTVEQAPTRLDNSRTGSA